MYECITYSLHLLSDYLPRDIYRSPRLEDANLVVGLYDNWSDARMSVDGGEAMTTLTSGWPSAKISARTSCLP